MSALIFVQSVTSAPEGKLELATTRSLLTALLVVALVMTTALVAVSPGSADATEPGGHAPVVRQSPSPPPPTLPTDGTIVYIHEGAVWISTPDGERRAQVTADGEEYVLPQVDADGTIWAIHDVSADERSLVGLSTDGEVTDGPVPLGAAPMDLAVNDAGTIAAYSYLATPSPRGTNLRFQAISLTSDPLGQPIGEPVTADGIGVDAFAGDLFATAEFSAYLWTPGTSPTFWFGDGDTITEIDASIGADRLVVVGQPVTRQFSSVVQTALLDPDEPEFNEPQSRCSLNAVSSEVPRSPSLSPDGSGVALEVTTFGDPSIPQVIVLSTQCGSSTSVVVADAARYPFWSPLDLLEEPPVDPGTNPPVPPAGTTTLSIGDVAVQEGDEGSTDVEVDLLLSRPLGTDLDVTLRLTEDTATQDDSASPFTRQATSLMTVKVEAGQTDAQAVIAIAGDEDNEPDETFVVEVVDTAPRVDVADGEGTITILDDDSPDDLPRNEPLAFSDTCLVPTDGLGMVKDAPTSPALVALGVNACAPAGPTARVLLARDDDFPDAMAAGVMQDDAPLLLVPGQGPLPDDVRQRLLELGPTEVVLLGGPAAVSEAIEAELITLGLNVSRRQGPTRLETAVDIATQEAVGADTIVLARAFGGSGDPTQAFADAIAAGGLAAESGWPILLTETAALSPATEAFILNAGVRNVHIMGGTAAVSQAVEDTLTGMGLTVQRAAGSTRVETALAVADLRGEMGEDLSSVILVDGASPTAWAGGFTAAHASAQDDAPIVRANGSDLPAATAAWLADNASTTTFAQVGADRPLTCVSTGQACAAAREALGLPGATVTIDPANLSPAVGGQPVGVVIDTDDNIAGVRADGSCLRQPTTDLSALAVRADLPNLPCLLRITVTFADGTSQATAVAYT